MKARTSLLFAAVAATGMWLNSASAQMHSPDHAQMHTPDHAHKHAPDHFDRQFTNAEEWAKSFDDPARDQWQLPERVIQALALAPNATVADIGSGTGYFAVRLARSVPQGRVLGIDIQPDMVRYLNERAKRDGLANLTAQLGAKDDPQLAVPLDLVIVVNTYHHIGGRDRYFRHVRDALKPGGRLVIIDFRQDAEQGPPKQFRISTTQVQQEMAKAGFSIVKEETFLPQQYLLVLQRAN
jgi:cyclopropane fatty-acyl-phospholipid synthase-like methyltransferase